MKPRSFYICFKNAFPCFILVNFTNWFMHFNPEYSQPFFVWWPHWHHIFLATVREYFFFFFSRISLFYCVSNSIQISAQNHILFSSANSDIFIIFLISIYIHGGFLFVILKRFNFFIFFFINYLIFQATPRGVTSSKSLSKHWFNLLILTLLVRL